LIAAAAAAALALAAPASARVSPFWRALAKCETGGRWDWGARHRPGEGHVFEGGLGFYASTWRIWSEQLGIRYRHAWQAPPPVQVLVASWGLAHGGNWGCLRSVPRDRFPVWTPPWLDVAWPPARVV
jgi:hypothetical protein